MATTSSSVILVDPNATWRRQGRELLRARGYDVLEFADGERAFAYLRTHVIDLVIADFLAVKASMIKWKGPREKGPRFVLLIRRGTPDAVAECFRCGAFDCAIKPIDEVGLFDIVNRSLSSTPAETRARAAGA
jgi:DNA-binding NtrC family response regulator